MNGETIYGTHVLPPYKIGTVALTQKDGIRYAIRLYPAPSEHIDRQVLLPLAGPVRAVSLLGSSEPLHAEPVSAGILVSLPHSQPTAEPPFAQVFRLT